MKVWEALDWVTLQLKNEQVENPRLQAELLLAHALQLTRERLYTQLQARLEGEQEGVLKRLVGRRIMGEPLQYILGRQEFWSVDLRVDPRVLIPRPETEILVEQALLLLSQRSPREPCFVLEIGTGSGAVAIALSKENRSLSVVATDISMGALLVAKGNAILAGVAAQIHFLRGDLFRPFPRREGREPFDLILSNPPYVSRSDISGLDREVKDFEPTIALDGGVDGLDFYQSIIPEASDYLKDGGWLLLEAGQGQAPKVCELVAGIQAFLNPESIRDLAGIERLIKAQKRSRAER